MNNTDLELDKIEVGFLWGLLAYFLRKHPGNAFATDLDIKFQEYAKKLKQPQETTK